MEPHSSWIPGLLVERLPGMPRCVFADVTKDIRRAVDVYLRLSLPYPSGINDLSKPSPVLTTIQSFSTAVSRSSMTRWVTILIFDLKDLLQGLKASLDECKR